MGGNAVKLLVVMAAACAVVIAGAATPAAAAPSQSAVSNCTPGAGWGTLRPDLASAALGLVNQHRSGMGLGALKTSPGLQASSDWKALHMAEYQYLEHDDPAPPVARTAFQRMSDC